MSEYVSVSERNLQKKFEEARKLAFNWKNKRVVMFFDEADSFFEKSWSQDNHKWWMVNIFLSATDWIDKKYLDNIIIIFTTNKFQVIPEAVLDRLNLKLKIDLPNEAQRVEHFKLNINNINLKAVNNNFDNIDYNHLATKTEWKSGRFINRLIENTVRNFIKNRRTQNTKHINLITTQDIINCIWKVDELENTSKWIWFHANIK
jgi:SpoVK/Ycf46/Vps4 family AAA+-type ATPase